MPRHVTVLAALIHTTPRRRRFVLRWLGGPQAWLGPVCVARPHSGAPGRVPGAAPRPPPWRRRLQAARPARLVVEGAETLPERGPFSLLPAVFRTLVSGASSGPTAAVLV